MRENGTSEVMASAARAHLRSVSTSRTSECASGRCTLVCHDPRPDATVRMFAFPYAGGSAQIYRTWPARLPQTVELFCLQLPGRGAQLWARPFDRLMPLVQAVADAIRPLLDRPFVFFGHSMGALIGFELVRELRRRTAPLPQHLFVAGCVAPQRPSPFRTMHLSDEDFLAELRRINGIPDEAWESPELLKLVLPAVRADCALTETYVYTSESRLPTAITALGGIADPLVGRADLDGWHAHTSEAFSLRMLHGDHFFVQSASISVLEILARTLSAIPAPQPSAGRAREQAIRI
jgi:medium-chain acyl-[acyl-carrier-protein] hydrolase